ncbi:MAG: hypothetical protein IPK79_02220 [Vampirovibrionales bacterium]|nr:hypothetical protein [Vampirovibrionales bacterium]
MDALSGLGAVTTHQIAVAATQSGKLHETGAPASTDAQEAKRAQEVTRNINRALKNQRQRAGASQKGVLA